MVAIKLYDVFVSRFRSRLRFLLWSCLVLFHSSFHGLPLTKHFDFLAIMGFRNESFGNQSKIFACFSSKCSAFPLPPSIFPSLPHIYFLSPITLVDSPSAPQSPLTDARLTDLPPLSHHWLPAWQSWFNARFWLVRERQANLWPCYDSTLAVFDVSYRSVAYGTQKRCQVSIVKPSPQGKEQGVLDIPDVMRARGGGERERERERANDL